ncbi:hypothetical protein GGR51DRAFT_521432 [Nemania sp. FL0031]|nr:hypothetical protein GGR51DRAFT_521432 [Nemania sp. FL0031]
MASPQLIYHCGCNRKFATPAALAQHRRDSPRHQSSQEQRSIPNVVTPTSITTDVTTHPGGNNIETANPTLSGTATSTIAPSQKQSTAQRKKKKKKNHSQQTRQVNRPTQSRAYSPLRRYYNPNWELEYQISGPDHTQCSPDCDWCGICAIREPY